LTGVGRPDRHQPALHLHLDFANVSVGRDFNLVLPSGAGQQEREEERATLSGLMARVRAAWIDGVLHELVPAGVPILLETGLDRGRILNAGNGTGTIVETAVARVGISEAFDLAGGALLILGEPGSGKTVALLDLARTLMERAETDAAQPVPVVFSLASWGRHRLPLAEWMTGQLSEFYKMPRRQGRMWLRDRRLIPLLDGLDEVDPLAREACVRAINDFAARGAPGMAVSCRVHAYDALPSMLRLNAAVRIRPLAPARILEHVAAAGAEFNALHDALRDDPALLDLARTPLMLRVMMSAYRGISEVDLVRDDLLTAGNRRRHVFDTFMNRAFREAVPESGEAEAQPPFDEDSVIDHMAWLAAGMERHDAAVFLVERLQPDWLAGARRQWGYVLLSRVAGGLALGLILGIILEMVFVFVGGGYLSAPGDAAATLLFGTVFGLAGGLVAGIADGLRLRPGSDRPAPPGAAQRAVYIIGFAALGTLLFAAMTGGRYLLAGAAFGLLWGRLFRLFYGAPRSRTGLGDDIRTVETLVFSLQTARRRAKRFALHGLVAGFAAGVLSLLAATPDPITAVITVLLPVLAGSLAGAVIGGTLGGLGHGYVDWRSRPNEGVMLSMRNMVLGAGVAATASAIILVPLTGLFLASPWGWALGAAFSLFVGLVAMLWYGGMDVIRHYLLRLLLATDRPRTVRIVPVLEYAVRLGILQRAGGGYLFIHRLLREYFDESDPA
jgi:eukaryotic-like serine/threonine-protein kinase